MLHFFTECRCFKVQYCNTHDTLLHRMKVFLGLFPGTTHPSKMLGGAEKETWCPLCTLCLAQLDIWEETFQVPWSLKCFFFKTSLKLSRIWENIITFHLQERCKKMFIKGVTKWTNVDTIVDPSSQHLRLTNTKHKHRIQNFNSIKWPKKNHRNKQLITQNTGGQIQNGNTETNYLRPNSWSIWPTQPTPARHTSRSLSALQCGQMKVFQEKFSNIKLSNGWQ